ncbi:MAG: HPr(Ser) kinase/phosphatase [Acidobacteriota bacterium]
MSSDDRVGEAERISVRELLSEDGRHLELELVTGGDGLDREIVFHRIQKPGLAMTGYVDFVRGGRVQVLGESEMRYLGSLGSAERRRLMASLCALPIPCITVTKGLDIPDEVVELCATNRLPLLRSPLVSSTFIDRITLYLDSVLAPRTTVHGVLVDVYGVGVLITGSSGVGKSECALDLIVRGHRLVADDIVEIRCRAGEILMGRGPELIRHHMELRGLGILNIEHLFGAASVRDRKRVEIVVLLEQWDEDADYDRLGLDRTTHEILGVALPFIRLPVASGRNLSILIEVAVRNHILKLTGFHPAEELTRRLQEAMEKPEVVPLRLDPDEGDME